MRDDVFPREFVVMPDHFHGLIRIIKGKSELGHVIGAFKAAVSRRIRRGDRRGDCRGDSQVAHPEDPEKEFRIWHRNYYERIVRSEEAERRIAQYIRLNPWRCVMDFGDGLRGMGNPSLWNGEKIGVLASRGRCAINERERPAAESKTCGMSRGRVAFMSGFHSPIEKEIFAQLLEQKQAVIWCPAWEPERAISMPEIIAALKENRMLMLEMRNRDGNLAAAEQRNRFILENADRLWLPSVTPGGMLERLIRELKVQDKIQQPGASGPPRHREVVFG